MSGHTKGPWEVTEGSYIATVERGPSRFVASIVEMTNKAGGREADEANARLIAAAPELLEALKLITKQARSWHDFHHGSDIVSCDSICDVLPACEAVISKAEATNGN